MNRSADDDFIKKNHIHIFDETVYNLIKINGNGIISDAFKQIFSI